MTELPSAQSQSLPIKKVVLYSSGVAYFEHQGNVNGSGTTELRFRASQMNDVLKSLLLQDFDGGQISTVVYPSQDPVDKILGSFDINLSGNPSMGEVLMQMRGSEVMIQAGTDVHEGLILGVEHQEKHVDGAVVTTDAVSIISNGKIKTLPLSQVDVIELKDKALQNEFTKALQAVAQARDQDKKPLHITHKGSGRRQILVGYVVESPVWKTSYRLVLPEAGKEKGYLQGWAIIENQTENDWENVELTLISGRPISFIQDLYNPLYIQRPVVKFDLQENLMPQSYDQGMEMEEVTADAWNPRNSGAEPVASPAPRMAKRSQPSGGRQNMMRSVQTAASTGETGELYQYVIGNVTLPRQRSAMIPIVTEEVDMQRVSIFNPSAHARHPMHGVRMQNSTDIHLSQGPATVLDDGSYAGDARMNELSPDGKQLVSYALDFQMHIDVTNHGGNAVVQSAKIVNGILQTQRKVVSETHYTLKNEAKKTRDVIIEHSRKHGWELRDTEKPLETTEGHQRFLVEISAEDQKVFKVKEERVSSESVHLSSLNINSMSSFATNGRIPEAVKKAINKAIEIKRKANQVQADIKLKQSNLQVITNEQERIRENMATVERNSSYYKRLLSKLESQEDQIEGIQKDVADLQKKKEGHDRELQAYLAGLNVN